MMPETRLPRKDNSGSATNIRQIIDSVQLILIYSVMSKRIAGKNNMCELHKMHPIYLFSLFLSVARATGL